MHTDTDIHPLRQRAASTRRTAGFLAGVLATVAGGFVLAATSVGALGDPAESTFVPITPCRLFDTRPEPDNVGPRATPIGPADSHVQQVTGANGFCNIPTGATAVALNAIALGATENSFVTFWPSDVARPLASSLNTRPGQGAEPNKVDVKLSADGKVSMYNQNGSVNLVADVVGYYTAAPQVIHTGSSTNSMFATNIGTAPTSITSVTVVAPTAGVMIADYAAVVDQTDAGQFVRCQANRLVGLGSTGYQQVESPGANGSISTLSGPFLIDVDAGESVTVHLVCVSSDSDATVRNGHLTVSFASTAG